jgi:soluble lytic murein transglycosylase
MSLKKSGLLIKSPDELYDPEKNLHFGTYFLAELLKSNQMNWVKAVASYNAKAPAVKAWFQKRFRGDYLEFIEEIPYEETRSYVKLVYRNWSYYRHWLNQIYQQKDLGPKFPAVTSALNN